MTAKSPHKLVRRNFHSSKEMLGNLGETPGGPGPATDFKHKQGRYIQLGTFSKMFPCDPQWLMFIFILNLTIAPWSFIKQCLKSGSQNQMPVNWATYFKVLEVYVVKKFSSFLKESLDKPSFHTSVKERSELLKCKCVPCMYLHYLTFIWFCSNPK